MGKPTSILRAVCAALAIGLPAWTQGALVGAPVTPGHQTAAPEPLQGATWFAEGAARPRHVLYAVVDPNCPFCHELWQSAQPLYKSGVQVRYLLVGFLAANSPGKAAAIIEAPRPATAWDWNETHWQQLPGDLGGGIRPLTHPRPQTLDAIHRNEALARDLGILGTPAVIYFDPQGRLHVVQSALDPTALKKLADAAAAR